MKKLKTLNTTHTPVRAPLWYKRHQKMTRVVTRALPSLRGYVRSAHVFAWGRNIEGQCGFPAGACDEIDVDYFLKRSHVIQPDEYF